MAHGIKLKEKVAAHETDQVRLERSRPSRCLSLAFSRDGLELDKVDELTFRISFDRTLRWPPPTSSASILAAVEVRDLLIEDESIEEVVKRIYAGEANLEVPA